ncbi:very short patch repair endonuclease [Alcanivorax sp. HI0083]|nr:MULTISPECIES: very short patch repair endonuclease [unclassified Alcanivorax]KZY29343.1 very short patch repair endonuclease [Alcanivorax sp. HI0044]KZZ25467.1 very short patch repair endonuclease [Alcanivorax sp. HI0083]
MVDVVDKATRSRMMAGIKGKDTKPEILIRSELHRRGFRFRKNVKDLPGKPDIVLPKYKAVIMVNGCFWHGHECHLFKWPSTRPEFWREKIEANKSRDVRNLNAISRMGWRVCIVWECSIKGKDSDNIVGGIDLVSEWLISDSSYLEVTYRVGSRSVNF